MAQTPPAQPLFDPARAARLMDEAGVDLILASRRANVAYLADCFGVLYWEYPEVAHCLDMEDDGCAMPYYFVGLPREGAPFVVAHENRAYLLKRTWITDVRPACWQRPGGSPVDCLVSALTDRKLGRARIGVEMNNIPALAMDALRQRLPHASFVDATPILWRMRVVKTGREIERQRQAYRIAEGIYRDLIAMLGSGNDVTVPDVRAMQMATATRAGCPPLHFGYVFPQDGRTKLAWDHANAPRFRFERGDVVLLDLGLIWRGYTTDFGRNLTLGKAPAEIRDLHDRTVQCRQEIASRIKPGVRIADVASAAVEIRKRLNLPPRPAVGHGLGIECHEPPNIGVTDPTVLEEGMTIVIELCEGIGKIAILLEDAGLVTARGWESLTEMGTGLVEIG